MTTRLFTDTETGFNFSTSAGYSYYEYQSFYKQMNGTNTANYRQVKKKNLPINGYSMEGFRVQPSVRTTTITDIDPLGSATVNVFSGTQYFIPSLAPPDFMNNFESALTSKTLSKIKNSSVNVAQAFGERQQTFSMIANTARRLAGAYSSLRKGNLWKACKDLSSSTFELDRRHPGASRRFRTTYPDNPRQAASNAWLELQYGWRPLLSDVYGSAEFLAEKHVRDESDVYDGRESVKVGLRDKTTSLIGGPFYSDISVSGKYVISYQVTNPLLRYSAMLGMTNPALLAWELTPFSFVVDWFLPIGNYLSNIDSCYGVTFLQGCKSIKQTSTSVGYDFYRTIEPSQVFESKLQLGPSEAFSLVRTPLGEFPSNTLPRLKNPISVSHAISAVALLVQVFRR